MKDVDPFIVHVQSIHRELGIPDAYVQACGLSPCPEPDALVATELDHFQRPQRLTPEAFSAWTAMKSAAAADGVSLWLLSAYRSIDYQRQLIARKLAAGQTIDNILKVNAAPGFSEHHTGRAVDIGTADCEPLTEAFEGTPAFAWLSAHAATFGFTLSYPRGNPWGIDYEPWHWCHQLAVAAAGSELDPAQRRTA